MRESTRFRLRNKGVIKAAIKTVSLSKGSSGLVELLTGTVKCDGDVIEKFDHIFLYEILNKGVFCSRAD